MNPVVVIATHERRQITEANILSLQCQSLVPSIVVVVSDPSEGYLYSSMGAHVAVHPNSPLGSKWQAGVEFARKLMASHLIITGSDDILEKHFVFSACNMDRDFIGLRRWYVAHNKSLYMFDYLAAKDLPLGGGRCYSRRLLDNCDWKIFDRDRTRLLDDHGFDIAFSFGNYALIHQPLILAIKGNWEMLNPFANHLKSNNARLIKKWDGRQAKKIIKEHFNYDLP